MADWAKASASDVNKMYQYLTDKTGLALTPQAAAAVLGNLITESQLDPVAVEKELSSSSGTTRDTTGISFAQWSTKNSHDQFFNWVAAHCANHYGKRRSASTSIRIRPTPAN